ncbi:polysaccharide deacetylase family protein [candidate division KSB1 bacterium]|nr:polysaccharide deacetylase family protein [candidate division KSB1 bacterium]
MKKPERHRIILLYHEVTHEVERLKPVHHIDPAYSLHIDRFKEQMKALSDLQNLEVAPLESFFTDDGYNHEIAITFDDGLKGNYDHAANVLSVFKFNATFFVTVNDIGTPDYMTWKQLKELDAGGHSIQSHTLSHPMLAELTRREITVELRRSKEIIEDKIGKQVSYLSIPLDSCNQTVIDIARQVGYRALFTSKVEPVRNHPIHYHYGRIPIKDHFTLPQFMALINPSSARFHFTQSVNGIKNGIKSVIGLETYRMIYRYVKKIEI